MSIPERIQSIIEMYGLNAQRFAETIGAKTKQSVYDLLAGRTKSISKGMAEKILTTFPEINENWLLTGRGEMLPKTNNIDDSQAGIPHVPLFPLDVVAGFSANEEISQSIEKLIPWAGAREGDFAVHVSGDSMQPAIPDGGLVLLRPAPFGDMFDIQFGKVHAVCIDDDRTLLKQIKPDHNNQANVILASFNPDYPPISIPISSVRRLFLAKSVKYDF